MATLAFLFLLRSYLILVGISHGNLSYAVRRTKDPPRCVPGVARFSSGVSAQHFYECADGSVEPILLQCPVGQVYVTHKKECMNKSQVKSAGPLNDKAMGRNVQLGSMFDGRENRYFADTSFWSQRRIEEEAFKYNRKEVKTEYSANKRVRQKMSSWGVDAHFSLDLLGGLISIGGSAAYARETIDTDTEVNVQMTYHTTKYSQTLPKKTPIDYSEECDSNKYTHVVTSVTYGMDAVFVFKRVVHEHEFEGKISGSLGWILKAIPGLSEGHSYDYDEEVLSTATLSMYGDFAPNETLPATLEQAVEFYKKLPALYGSGTILDVHLTPISEFCSDVDVILNEISNDLVAKSSDVLDEIEQLGMKTRGLLKSAPSIKFSPLSQNLNIYKAAYDNFEVKAKAELGEILPNIRGGTGHGEDDLVAWIDTYLNSCFQFDKSFEFLVDRSREVKAIGFLLESLEEHPNIKFADYENANDVEFIFKYDLVMILEFNILNSEDIVTSFLAGAPVDESQFWYNQVDVTGDFGAMLRLFQDFAMENMATNGNRGYLVKLSPLKEDVLMVLNAYIKGGLFSNSFEIPRVPKDIVPYDVSIDSFKVNIPRFNQFTTGCRYFVHDLNRDIVIENTQMFDPEGSPDDIMTLYVKDLIPLTKYSISLQYLTDMGRTPPTLPVQPILTTGCSQPQGLVLERVSYDSGKISWMPPAIVADQIKEQLEYRVKIVRNDVADTKLYKEIITKELTAVVDGLVPASHYSVFVSAFVTDYPVSPDTHVTVESLASVISMVSSPLPPVLVLTGEANMESLTLQWSPPTEIAVGSNIERFSIKYAALDQNGTKVMEGSAKQMYVSYPDDSVVVPNLIPGFLYAFSSQIYTSNGISENSIGVILRTKFNQTQLEEARHAMTEYVMSAETSMAKRSRFCVFNANIVGGMMLDSLYVSDNNVDGAEMTDGSFQAGEAGLYQVLVNTEIATAPGFQHSVWIMVNGVKLEESRIHTTYSIYSTGKFTENGSREILLNLKAGDKVSLKHDSDQDNGVVSVSLCVSSIGF